MEECNSQKVIVEEITCDDPLSIDVFMSVEEIMANCYREGKKTYRQNMIQIFVLSFITGIQFCLGIHAALMIVTDMDSKTYTIKDGTETLLYTTKHSYSYSRIIIGALTPLGLILTGVIGGNLFLESAFYFSIVIFNRSMRIGRIFINLFVTYFANLIGALFYTLFFGYLSNQFDSDVIKNELQILTTKKLDLSFGYTLVNGIGAGIALGVAFLLSNGSKTVICKLSSLWIPYIALITMGFEHYIENFFLIGCSLMYGIDGSVAKFLFVNIAPITLGNIIGVVAVIAMTYNSLFFSKEKQQKLKCQQID